MTDHLLHGSVSHIAEPLYDVLLRFLRRIAEAVGAEEDLDHETDIDRRTLHELKDL